MTSATRLNVAVTLLAFLGCLGSIVARAETYPPIPPSLTTPEQVETSIGTLKFRDGIPDAATEAKAYDQLDLQRGDSEGEPFDGGKTYKVTLPPAAKF